MIKARILIFAGNIRVGDINLFAKIRLQNICHQNLSPISIYGSKMKQILLQKSFILEVQKENRAYQETNFTWADFWYKLIISADNKRRKSVTKISSPICYHQNPVWELKLDWDIFLRLMHVFVCYFLIELIGSSKESFRIRGTSVKKVIHKLWSIYVIRKTVVSCDCSIISDNTWQWIF